MNGDIRKQDGLDCGGCGGGSATNDRANTFRREFDLAVAQMQNNKIKIKKTEEISETRDSYIIEVG